MTLPATLPPPPITQADRARADARAVWNEVTQRMVYFTPQSSLPAAGRGGRRRRRAAD